MNKPADRSQSQTGNSFLDGLTKLLETVERLAEKGQELRESIDPNDPARQPRVHYGFSIRTAGQRNGETSQFKVEPFGNLRRDKATGETVVDDTREPIVDVFNENGKVLVVAEMPGIDASHINLTLDKTTLTIQAINNDKKYRTQIELEHTVDISRKSITCNHGIIEITLPVT
ncbi:MAG: Hsp20/alpha crystallin family protein [Deltaproteobacteria bacterium]|nr:Hsp20/alpha crystallin family protein [Deltaproteobacteria bacterium]